MASWLLVIPADAANEDDVSPEIAVLVTLLTRPFASVVSTGIVVAFPYVPAVPTLGKLPVTVIVDPIAEIVLIPPPAIVNPPVRLFKLLTPAPTPLTDLHSQESPSQLIT